MVEEKKYVKTYPIFKDALAIYLMTNGFRLIRTRENLKDTKHNIYFFRDSKRLREYIEIYNGKVE